ncbi:MAG: hypothetical protein IKD31_04195 [Clostridia bacterium]|nr:hypothetical protein [Clostridia bacterium]
MYKVIVLGASCLAAGLAKRYQKECLVIERSAWAGYEFFGALNFGCHYEKPVTGNEAKALQKLLAESPAGPYGFEANFYPFFKEAKVRFQTELISVQKTADGFLCETHGVNGYRLYEAEHIIDTRCTPEMSLSKSYNLLIESPRTPDFSGVRFLRGEMENHWILQCEVPLFCNYPQARSIVLQVMENFSEGEKLILSANEFDYQVKEKIPASENGILLLPSKQYDNPILALDAGLTGKEAAL